MVDLIEVVTPVGREVISWGIFLSLVYLALKFSLWVAGSMAPQNTRDGSRGKGETLPLRGEMPPEP